MRTQQIEEGILKIPQIETQLDNNIQQLEDKSFYNTLQVSKKQKARITILDDDTRIELYTIIFPLLKEYNIKITSAVISSRIGLEGYINMEQYREMRDSGLVEFISHTHSHKNLATDLTLEQAERDILECKNWLIRNGGNADYIVPPFGGVNDDVRNLIRKYHKGSYVTNSNGYINYPPLDTFNIKRCDFEATLTQKKLWIDEAKVNEKWVIFNSHAQYQSFTEQEFREIIEYCNSIGIEFDTVGGAMKHFGNILDIDSSPTSNSYSGIDSNGVRFGEMASCFYKINATNIKFDTPATDVRFKVGKTIVHFTSSLASSYGWMGAGTLETTNTNNESFVYQIYKMLQSNAIYHRYWTGTAWSEFVKISDRLYYDFISRTGIISTTPITNFQQGVSICTYNSSSATTSGFIGAGILYTHRMASDEYSYQRYKILDSNIELNRNWTGSGWSAWVNVTGNYKATTSQRNQLVIDLPKLEVGYQCYDTTLQIPIYWNGTNWKKYSDNSIV